MAETADVVETVKQGYAFEGAAIELGALLVDGRAETGGGGPDPAVDGEPARPGRGRHRYR